MSELIDLAEELRREREARKADPVVALADELRAERETRLGETLRAATERNPDEEAKVQRLAGEHGVDPSFARENATGLEAASRANALDPSAMLKDSPGVAAALSDPDTAAAAHDDTGPLMGLEGSLRGLATATAPKWGGGIPVHPGGGLDVQAPLTQREREFGRYRLAGGPSLAGLAGALAMDVQIGGMGVARGFGGATKWITGGRVGNDFTFWADETIRNMQAQQGRFSGYSRAAPTILDETIQSAASSLVFWGPSIAARGGAALLAKGGETLAKFGILGADAFAVASEAATEAGNQFEDLTRSGISADQAGEAATKTFWGNVLLVGLTNKFGILGDSAKAGVALEGVQEFMQEIIPEVAAGTTGLPTREVTETLGGAFKAGAIGGIVGGGMQAGILSNLKAQRDQGKVVDAIASLGESATASKLRERLPERFRQVVDSIVSRGEVDRVFVDSGKWTEFHQSQGADPKEAARDLLGEDFDESAYDEAVAAGGDLEIPLGYYVEKVAPTDLHNALAEDIRFHADDMSAREAKEFQADVQKRFEEAQKQAEDEGPSPLDEITDDLTQKLVMAGKKADVARTEATLQASIFNALAQRSGMDPADLYAKWNVQVQGPVFEELRRKPVDDTALFIDKWREWAKSGREAKVADQGPSLTQFLAKKGGVKDAKGELKAMDAAKLKRGLVRGKGMSLDDAALAAQEAGFFPELGEERVDLNAFIDAIREDIGGRKRFASIEAGAVTAEDDRFLREFDDAMKAAGLDEKATEEEIRKAVEEKFRGTAGIERFQEEKSVKVDPKALTDEVLSKMNKHLKSLGYDVRGKDDIRNLLELRMLDEGKLWHPDWITAYERATESRRSRIEKVAKKKEAKFINWSRLRELGTTSNLDEAGYITPSGSLIDLSGKKEGGSPGIRSLDHREAGGTAGMQEFMAEGNIRMDANSGMIDAAKALTSEQETKVRALALRHNGELVVELEDGLGEYDEGNEYFRKPERTLYREYPKGTRPERIITDIRKFFAGEEVAQVSIAQRFRGGELDQSGDGKRASILFGDKATVIKLFRGHDLSSFAHESGHLGLRMLADLSAMEGADALKADMDTLLKWMGVDSWEKVGVAQEEQFASAWEAYLREGNAPSAGLRSVFHRLRSWLLVIYRNAQRIAGYDLELTDEVRAVMDRMLATEEEISEARDRMSLGDLFTDAKAAGLDAKKYERLRVAAEKAKQAAIDNLEAAKAREAARHAEAWWKEERAKVLEEVTADVHQRPVYAALRYLRDGLLPDGTRIDEAVKLDRKELKADYGAEALKRLPKGIAADKGASADEVAELFGFGSGDEMVKELMAAPELKGVIQAETDLVMASRHGDMATNKGQAAAEAVAAVHNTEQARALLEELNALQDLGNLPVRRIEFDTLREAASDQVERAHKIGQLDPRKWITAEVRAAEKAGKTVAKKDFRAAVEAKRQQLMNHFLAIEGKKAREEADKALAYIARVQKSPTIDPEYMEQIAGILQRFELRPRVTQGQLAKRQSFAAWLLGKLSEEGGQEALKDVVFDDTVLADAYRKHWKDLTLEELRGVRDTVKNLEHLGRLKNRLLADKAAREFKAVRDVLVGSILARNTLSKTSISPDFKERIRDTVRKFHLELVKTETVLAALDGYDELGPLWEAIYKPIAEAADEKGRLMEEAFQKVKELYSVYSYPERAKNGKLKFYREVNDNLTHNNLIALALNWGNEGNRQRVRDGFGWDTAQVESLLAYLDEKDWKFVESVWQFIDSYWPALNGLSQDVRGVPLEKVQGVPVQTPYGTITGGYYPIKYDPRLSGKAQEQEEKKSLEDYREASVFRAGTRRGYEKGRAEKVENRPVNLSMDVLHGHLEEVTHALAFTRAVVDVDRLLHDTELSKAVTNVMGFETVKALRSWIQAVAARRNEPLTVYEKRLLAVKNNVAVVAMGFKVTTALAQFAGLSNAMAEVGPKWIAAGAARFAAHPFETIQETRKASQFMVNRMASRDRETLDVMRNPAKTAKAELQKRFFVLAGYADAVVATIAWQGGYLRKLSETGDTEAAKLAGDQAVRKSQGSGGMESLSALQRRPGLMQLFTMFYTPFSALYSQTAERFGRYNAGKMGIGGALFAAASLWLIPAIMNEVVAGRGPDWDDEDERRKWMLRNILTYPAQMFPLARDVATAAAGERPYSITPLADVFETAVKLTKRLAEQESFDELAFKQSLNLLGYWVGLPTRQMWITGEAAARALNGENVPLYEFALPRKR